MNSSGFRWSEQLAPLTCDWYEFNIASSSGVPTLPAILENDVGVDLILPLSSHLHHHLQVNSDNFSFLRCCLPVALHFSALRDEWTKEVK